MAERLSQTGCVDPRDPREPAAGLIPYDVASPLWSDGAVKERFLALPDGTQIQVKDCAREPAPARPGRGRDPGGRRALGAAGGYGAGQELPVSAAGWSRPACSCGSTSSPGGATATSGTRRRPTPPVAGRGGGPAKSGLAPAAAADLALPQPGAVSAVPSPRPPAFPGADQRADEPRVPLSRRHASNQIDTLEHIGLFDGRSPGRARRPAAPLAPPVTERAALVPARQLRQLPPARGQLRGHRPAAPGPSPRPACATSRRRRASWASRARSAWCPATPTVR